MVVLGESTVQGGGFPAVTLKDVQGGLAAVLADEKFDVRSLPVGPPDKAEARGEDAAFTLPFNIAAGKYDVYVSVGTRTGSPASPCRMPATTASAGTAWGWRRW
jgi:hypothetical protein